MRPMEPGMTADRAGRPRRLTRSRPAEPWPRRSRAGAFVYRADSLETAVVV
jgi:hypothetical protein